MKKEKIFSKFNITIFNNELEEILDTKPFSENVKNNILNMIYKIEEAYNDYRIVKVEVPNQRKFLENILESIKNHCNLIEISNSIELEKKKYDIDYRNGSIKVCSNHTWMLYAILEILIKQKKFETELDIIQNKSIYDFLKLGYNVNNVEIIRDFNGWSWIPSLEESSNIYANLVYQNLQFLLTNPKLESCMNKILNDDLNLKELLQKELEKDNKKELVEELLNKLEEIAIYVTANTDETYREDLLEIKKRKQEELALMENKKEYLKEITLIKKTSMEEIKNIDKIISSKDLLQTEYKSRNSVLKNDEKIFSISYLVDILNEERKVALDKIAEVNTLMEPKIYIEKKVELENIIEKLSVENKNIDEIIIDMQKIFIKCFLEKIQFITEKNDIINMLYKIRYYANNLIKDKSCIKNSEGLKGELQELNQNIVQKLIENKLVFEFINDKEIINKILQSILETKIINLQKVCILLHKEKINLEVEIYDEDELINVVKFENKEIKTKNIKLDKKVKLFI